MPLIGIAIGVIIAPLDLLPLWLSPQPNTIEKALEEGIIRGAALDVFSNEPAKSNVLFDAPNLILTPHIAASTVEAQLVVAEQIAEQISDYFNKGEVKNSV